MYVIDGGMTRPLDDGKVGSLRFGSSWPNTSAMGMGYGTRSTGAPLELDGGSLLIHMTRLSWPSVVYPLPLLKEKPRVWLWPRDDGHIH